MCPHQKGSNTHTISRHQFWSKARTTPSTRRRKAKSSPGRRPVDWTAQAQHLQIRSWDGSADLQSIHWNQDFGVLAFHQHSSTIPIYLLTKNTEQVQFDGRLTCDEYAQFARLREGGNPHWAPLGGPYLTIVRIVSCSVCSETRKPGNDSTSWG